MEIQSSLVYQKKDDTDAFKQFILESDLSVRATNVLLTNIDSLEVFGRLTAENLSQLPNCGKKTVHQME